MSVSVAALAAAAAAGGAAQGGSQTLGGLLTGRYNRKEDASQSIKTYNKQAAIDYAWANGPYFDLAQKYNEVNYQLARRYSENSASWAVNGLKKAGLNPILAASQGFNADMGQQGVQGGQPSGSVPSVHGQPVNADFNFNKAFDIGNLDVQSSTASKMKADTNVAQATADYIKAQTMRANAETAQTLQDTKFTRDNLGFTGTMAPLGKAVNTLGDLLPKGVSNAIDSGWFQNAWKKVPSSVKTTINNLLPASKVGHWLQYLGSPSSSTQPQSNAKRIKQSVTDVHTAKELSDVLSPSPYPIEPDVSRVERLEKYGRGRVPRGSRPRSSIPYSELRKMKRSNK